MQTLEEEMTLANTEYIQAVARTSTFSYPFGRLFSFDTSCLNVLPPFIYLFTWLIIYPIIVEELHSQITDVLRTMLNESEIDVDLNGQG